jgi:hypothetical protein
MSEETKHHNTDTHSYKGWINSDSFWKRAFAILGYNTVASFVIAIPIYIIMFVIAMVAFKTLGMPDMRHMNGMRDNNTSETMPMGKVDIKAMCESMLANSGMEKTDQAAVYLKSCAEGEYQDAIDAYMKMMGADGKAI